MNYLYISIVLLLAPYTTVYAQSQSELTAHWWQWAMSFPEDINPIKNGSAVMISQPQHENVVFLTGSYNNTDVRNIILPHDKGIVMPILNWEESYFEAPHAKSVADLWKFDDTNNDTLVKATLDGKPLQATRVYTPLFYVYFPKNNVFETNQSGITQAVADGYWLFLKPLSVGQHILYIHGIVPGYRTEVMYRVNVV